MQEKQPLEEYLDQVEQRRAQQLDERFLALAESDRLTPEAQSALQQEARDEVKRLKTDSAALLGSYFRTAAAADELESRMRDARRTQKKRRFLPNPAVNSVVDLQEERVRHFAQGINFYKLFLILIIGSFFGVVVEMLWCLLKNGYVESRAGLVYGPFNLLYGAGAVALTVLLYRFRNRSALYSFLGGMIVGSAVEYVCSWAQEAVFGSRSWDYSHMPFNLNGRICLLYSFFWGALGVFWIKRLYPMMAQWILRIPNRVGKRLTWGLVVLTALNAAVTVAALWRWAARMEGTAAPDALAQLLDRRFPDARMLRIFPNMKFGS